MHNKTKVSTWIARNCCLFSTGTGKCEYNFSKSSESLPKFAITRWWLVWQSAFLTYILEWRLAIFFCQFLQVGWDSVHTLRLLLYHARTVHENSASGRMTTERTNRSKYEHIYKINYPCNRSWRPIALLDVEAPTFYRQSAQKWLWGCQP
jgi:hypothetical protein